MTTGKDNSEQVRIRTEYAEYIRGESKRLGKTFLSTLYWIVDNYRVQQAGRTPLTSANSTNVSHMGAENPSQVNQAVEMSDASLLDNLEEFE